MTTPTDRQLEALTYVVTYIDEHQRPPTLREICTRFGLSSTNAAADRLRGLIRKGLLSVEPKVSRGLRVTPNGRSLARLHQTLAHASNGADVQD